MRNNRPTEALRKETAVSVELMTVRFTHPRNSERLFTAETTPACTGQEAVAGLILGNEDGPFLEPAQAGRPYELLLPRTETAITPHMTLGQAGVVDGDVIAVIQRGQGA
jgi:hypothetical protein